MESSQWTAWWEHTGENELSTLLMVLWDPINVSDSPEAWSEYDKYAPSLARLVREQASVDQIARHLAEVERDRMEYSTPHESLRGVAEQLEACCEIHVMEGL
jgi:hypothetical protein